MTTLHVHNIEHSRVPEPSENILRISWSIARGALASPGQFIGGEHLLVIEVRLRSDFSVDGVNITIDGEATPEALTNDSRGAWTRDEHGFLLVRVFEAGFDTPLLDLTIETEGDQSHVLYVRTTVLHTLGISGGRYELAGARLIAEERR